MTTAEQTAPAKPASPGFLAALGAPVIDIVRDVRAILNVFARTIGFIVRGRIEVRLVLEQMHVIGNKSVFFISTTMGFIGMILVFQSALQALRIVPDLTMLGPTYLEVLIRDLAASIGAMMLATRVGAGIAAEIGSMVVTEQVDALRMCAADPIEYLVVPRFIASVVMTSCLLIWGACVATVAGMLTANIIFDVNYQTFLNLMLVDFGDVIVGLTKCIAYGAAIPIVSAQRGLTTFGGSEGVGWATTSAVVSSSLAVIILQFFISALGYLIFPGLIAMPIHFKQVSKTFGSKQVLNGVDLEVQDGECFFIIGASGVGKSVLIKHLIGLLRPDGGEIWLDGEEVSKLSEKALYPVRMKCAMVFQNSTLFDSMSCVENVALPLRKHRSLSMQNAMKEALHRLDQVHMREFANAFPAELGDGMRKRVAIARALTLDPRYVLFDEPTTSLDPVSARRVDVMIRELCDELGVTAIVVSHDLTSIFSIADRIAMLYKGQVRILGTREELRSTADGVVQQFIRGQAEGPMEV